MDEYATVTFANRDELIPSDSITTSGNEKLQESESLSEKPRSKVSAGYLKEKFHDLAPHHREKAEPGSNLSLQDRLFTKCVHRIQVLHLS